MSPWDNANAEDVDDSTCMFNEQGSVAKLLGAGVSWESIGIVESGQICCILLV